MTVRFRLGFLLIVSACLLSATPASAAPAPWWHLTQRVIPTHLQPEGEGTLVLEADNLGDAQMSGPATISIDLSPNVSFVEEGGVPQVSFFAYSKAGGSRTSAPPAPPSSTTAKSPASTSAARPWGSSNSANSNSPKNSPP